MGNFWTWLFKLSQKRLEKNGALRCEHCLRWDTEAPILKIESTAGGIGKRTLCSGCNKWTDWITVYAVPVWWKRTGIPPTDWTKRHLVTETIVNESPDNA